MPTVCATEKNVNFISATLYKVTKNKKSLMFDAPKMNDTQSVLLFTPTRERSFFNPTPQAPKTKAKAVTIAPLPPNEHNDHTVGAIHSVVQWSHCRYHILVAFP